MQVVMEEGPDTKMTKDHLTHLASKIRQSLVVLEEPTLSAGGGSLNQHIKLVCNKSGHNAQ